MRLLFGYVSRRVLLSIFMTFMIVISIIMLVDFVESTRNFDDGQFSSLSILWLTVLRTPQLIEETIPFVVLFGVMGALFNLNRRSELIVMRASGLSAWRFLTPAILMTAIVGILWTTTFNPLAAYTNDLRERTISEQSKDGNRAKDTSIWLRDGNEFEQTVIFAPRSDLLTQTLFDTEFTVFNSDESNELVFTRRYDAAEAVLLPTGYWQLTNVIENTANAEMEIINSVSWPTTITFETLQNKSFGGTLPQFWKLPAEINSLSAAGFSTTIHEMKLHKLLSMPLLLVAMACLAACVSMRLSREGGTFKLLLSGGCIGFSVYFIQNMVGAFGEAGAIDIYIAVWVVPFILIFGSIIYLSRIEDG